MIRLSRRHPMLALCLALLLCWASATNLLAQATTGTITGVVIDSTGAAVPNATVTVKNAGTGVARSVKSDAQGRYTASALANGTYSVTATAQGFKITALNGVNLDVNQTLNENLTLAAGGATEEISVEAQAITTDTETSSNGQVLGTEAVADLPLANRQFYNLVEVAPGVVPPAQGSSMGFRGGMNVNGAAETANMFILNGTDNVDISTNQAVFRPSVDTIAEFKVITGVPSADFGRMNGGQINIVTKAGSNKFHGSLYEYIRNGAIEAKPWSPTPQTLTPKFQQNTFGGTVGGPIMKDKAFFFFGYEGQRIRQQITASQTVPTAYQQAGCELNTGTQLYNPATGAALPLTSTGACAGTTGYDITGITDASGNVLWNGTSATYGKLMASLIYPTPNVAGTLQTQVNTGDYNFSEVRQETMDEFNTRFDFTQSSKDSWNASFNHFHDPSFEPNNPLCSSRSMPNFGCYTDQITWLFNVAETHIFSANLLNNVVFGWNRLQQPRVQQDDTSIGSKWPGLPGVDNPNVVSNDYGLPSVTVTGYTATGGQTNLPQNRWDNSFDFDEALTWTHKAHTFKFGAQFLVVKTTEYEVSNGRGNLAFNASSISSANGTTHQGTTGDSFADVLLGLPYTAAQTPTPVPPAATPNVYNRYNSFDFFAMDDWKILPNLTLNLGLRYELDMPETEKNGNFATFSPGSADPYTAAATKGPIAAGAAIGAGGVANPNGTFLVANQIGAKTVYKNHLTNFAPRLGFAWQPLHNERTVVKGGFGVFYTEPEAFNEMLSYSLQYPIRQAKSFTTGSYASGNSITLANPFPSTSLPTPGTPFCTTGGVNGCNTFAPNAATPCGNPCNLIPFITGTDVNPNYSTPYVAQWTLGVQRQATKNILAEALYFGNKGTKIAYGCTANLNYNDNPDAHLLGQNYTQAASATSPTGSTYNSVSGSALQVLREYPQWSTISYHTTGCNSWYHSLQARTQVTAKTGLSVLVSYTYGRAEDTLQAAQDPGKHAFDKELANFDVRHRIVISPVVPLPFGKGQAYLNSGLGSAILGGFKFSGIYQWFTGRPFSVTDATSYSSASAGGDRPDLVVGQSLTGYDPINHTSTHNHNEWFNVHSLAYNPPGTYGNLAPNTIEGPGWDELDLTLSRTFAIKEWAKAEFKIDTFNLLNHPNLFSPLNSSGAVGSTFGGTATYISTVPTTTNGVQYYPVTSGFTSLAYPVTPGYCAAGAAARSASNPTGQTVTLNGVTASCTIGGGANGAGANMGYINQANNMREIQASVHITF